MIENNLKEIYTNRFIKTYEKRERIWKILIKYYFQKFININNITLEIAAGYCHFINNIKSKKKFALDLNSDTKNFCNNDVEFILSSSTNITGILDNSIDTVFISNFFEHISKEDILKTIKEVRRVLKKGGNLIVLQPNIRFLSSDYWMYFDHITPIDDRALVEALELNSLNVIIRYPKFLPYTMQGSFPTPSFLIKVYLISKPLWYIFGKQALIISTKI